MIVEFQFSSDILQRALAEAPGMCLSVDELDGSDTVPLRNIFWAEGGDFEAFEAALETDPTVEGPARLAEAGQRRLYRVRYPEEVADVTAYRAAVDLDGIVLAARSCGDGWTVRMSFPDRSTFAAFRERCLDRGLEISIRSIYRQDRSAPDGAFGLTGVQRETLLEAVGTGYFDVPRETTLDDLGTRLGVSGQAASERVRRGMRALVTSTLGMPDGDG